MHRYIDTTIMELHVAMNDSADGGVVVPHQSSSSNADTDQDTVYIAIRIIMCCI